MKCDELKDYDIMDIEAMDDERLEKSESGKIQVTRVYIKSEVDAAIAELEESHKMEVEQLLIEIAEQKSEIERLEILCANYRHDCDNLAISNEQAKRAARTLLEKMNHNKRKRCLALARIANDDFHLSNQFYQMGRKEFEKRKCERYNRHHFKWLALADKFKEKA